MDWIMLVGSLFSQTAQTVPDNAASGAVGGALGSATSVLFALWVWSKRVDKRLDRMEDHATDNFKTVHRRIDELDDKVDKIDKSVVACQAQHRSIGILD